MSHTVSWAMHFWCIWEYIFYSSGLWLINMWLLEQLSLFHTVNCLKFLFFYYYLIINKMHYFWLNTFTHAHTHTHTHTHTHIYNIWVHPSENVQIGPKVSIFCVATIIFQHCLNPLGHGVHHSFTGCHWNPLPLIHDDVTELVDVRDLALLHLPFEDAPQMLNRV